jgi:uncharacterized protein involved in outer membrane biogenesis
MSASSAVRRSLTWAVALLAILIVGTIGLIAAIDAGYGRTVLVGFFASRIGRPVQVNGMLQTHLFSFNPWIVAEHVTIDNPPWMPAGRAAEIGRLSVVLNLPGFGHPAGIAQIKAQAASLYPVRDASGRANWQLTDPARKRVHRNSPIIRSLSLPNAHVVLADARRHLQFDGVVSVQDAGGPGAPPPLRIVGAGQLNGRAVSFELSADPLATASHTNPYHFTFAENSSGSRLTARGALPEPFDYTIADAAFEAGGQDLKDLYFLTGVHLLDTGDYHLTGNVSRRGTHTVFSELSATSGQTDMRGTVSIESSSGRPQLNIELHSRLLRLADLGMRAAGRTSEPKSPLLLSDAMLGPSVLQGRDAALKFSATRVDVGRLPWSNVSASATLDHNVLKVSPLLAEVLGGRADVHLRLDATKNIPVADVNIGITDLQLGQLPHKDAGPPPIEGLMQARILVTGAGRSVHQVAASANGTVSVRVPQGEIRESFAELTGIDLRGVGLLLTKNKRDVPLRCAFARFKAQAGTLIAESLVADTEHVLITGEGQIHLDSEALELEIRGQPKSLRLFRLRTPILVQGTLAHPSIGVQKNKSALLIVDSGKARDADCAALLAGATTE